eukprot:TRINITY_DN3190_c0_g1_i1.p1 TRINITY_DN3190_c0_g1~~TRINITY_DN3190_c0_g1_i1.p1  ORF type:complete len:200 (+),score=32.72 TRINITY_DN3190_c0_g1_i1:52-600(+)
MSPLDRQLRPKPEVSLSAFALLFAELVQYSQGRVARIDELETRLSNIGNAVGSRLLELHSFRDKAGKREVRIVPMLSFIATHVWKAIFGKTADIERSTENEDEYMISERDPLVNKFVSVPRELGQLNCAAFSAGIVRGVLDAAEFPARVTAHTVPIEGGKAKTTLLIKFLSPATLVREKRPQ